MPPPTKNPPASPGGSKPRSPLQHPSPNNSTHGPAPGQPTVRPYLVRPGVDLTKDLDLCPFATLLEGWSLNFNVRVLVALRCKRWGCPHCGRRKISHLANRVKEAAPNRLVTLTTWTEAHETPRAAYEHDSPMVARLWQRLRKRYQPIEYMRVTELHKNGYPHYHHVMRSPYIPHAEISAAWKELTGSYIVDVRKIKKTEDAYWYVAKYLAKQKAIPWTKRRVSWSRTFFPKKTFRPPFQLELEHIEQNFEPFEVVLAERYTGQTIYQIGSDCFAVTPITTKEQ